ncbi:MAG TPA: hypothetical protein VHB98_10610, partial [Chloroflexota bacterium]|nr:hypothetical protein [Chloroflexota bacterium]
AHYGFGTLAGALFAVLYRRLRLPLAAPLQGAIYGLLVWTSSYAGWVPALDILPPPQRDRKDRQLTVMVGHLIFGAVLGAYIGHRSADE